MRIYANLDTGDIGKAADYKGVTAIVFKQMAGKDIWVKCTRYGSEEGWVRILYYLSDGFEGSFVSQAALDQKEYYDLYANTYLRCRDFIISNPIQEATTQELCPDYVDYTPYLERFIGKDFWVLCKDLHSRYETRYYVRFNSVDKPSACISYVDASLVDGTSDEYGWTYWEHVLRDVTSGSTYDWFDSWEPILPYQLLTTEELIESLEQYKDKYAG